jgi:uncharacterized protein YgiM (DUF1202 family)
MDINDRLTGASLNRRSILKGLAGIGVAALAASPVLGSIAPAAARSTDSLIVNSSGARLRSGPGLGYSILASLAKGTEVRYLADGGYADGEQWYKVQVVATGKQGYIAAYLLSFPDGSGDPVIIIGSATALANVNLRSGPSTGYSVLRVVPSGAKVQITDTVQNGFRYVFHNGLGGWIHTSYLSHQDAPSETFTTTARLNLRTQPSATAPVILIIPENATVTALPAGVDGWRKVSYKGTVGWAATAYLN